MDKNKNKVFVTQESVLADKKSQLLPPASTIEHCSAAKEAEAALLLDPGNCDLWLKKAQALGRQRLNFEAVEALSRGLTYEPFNWLLLRNRAHRYIATYRFAEAAADFDLVCRINPHDWDTYYHLGLCYYLIGDYDRALTAYENCLAETAMDSENLVAITNWLWQTYMRLGRPQKASMLLENIDAEQDAGENTIYQDLVLLYRGDKTPQQAMSFDNEEFASLEYASRGYGVAMWHYYRGEEDAARQILDTILADDSFWTAFGYMAAIIDQQEGRLQWQ